MTSSASAMHRGGARLGLSHLLVFTPPLSSPRARGSSHVDRCARCRTRAITRGACASPSAYGQCACASPSAWTMDGRGRRRSATSLFPVVHTSLVYHSFTGRAEGEYRCRVGRLNTSARLPHMCQVACHTRATANKLPLIARPRAEELAETSFHSKYPTHPQSCEVRSKDG